MARKKSGGPVWTPGNSTPQPAASCSPAGGTGDRTPLEPTIADTALGTLRLAITQYVRRNPGTPPAVAAQLVVRSQEFAPVVAMARDPASPPLRSLVNRLRQGDPAAQRLADTLAIRLTTP